MFQFPSNGKVYCKRIFQKRQNVNDGRVSIPFKRESVLQAEYNHRMLRRFDSMFQFPSNGKVYCKFHDLFSVALLRYHVSIPFKRESVLQVLTQSQSTQNRITSFNSLQTGKCIASGVSFQAPADQRRVSIPFKRESVLQVNATEDSVDATFDVSIPFKRESVLQV